MAGKPFAAFQHESDGIEPGDLAMEHRLDRPVAKMEKSGMPEQVAVREAETVRNLFA